MIACQRLNDRHASVRAAIAAVSLAIKPPMLLTNFSAFVTIFEPKRAEAATGTTMSALGQKQTLGSVASMSALPPKADIPDQKDKGPAQWPVPPIARTSLW